MKIWKTIIAIVASSIAGLAAGQQINATINGDPVQFAGVQPMISHGRVMVPLRSVFERMGAFVEWNEMTRHIYVVDQSGRHITLLVDDPYAEVEGKLVEMDAPPLIVRGQTLLPLRFVSEFMDAVVEWNASSRTAAITMAVAEQPETEGVRAQPLATTFVVESSTVIPFKLNRQLSSDQSMIGEKFTATIDSDDTKLDAGLPEGAILEGHVDALRPQSSALPGVLGLAFDSIVLPNGETIEIDASIMDLGNQHVDEIDGRLVARQPVQRNLKYLGVGLGILAPISSRRGVVTSAAIGDALGRISDMRQKPIRYGDVTLRNGTRFGVMFNRNETFPIFDSA